MLERLSAERSTQYRRNDAFCENADAEYPDKALSPQDNVTNRLAREFYASHGVTTMAEGLDLHASTAGERVMVSDYCIRREIGQCLLRPHSTKGALFLEHGRKRYALSFDCKACRMSLTDISETNR